MIKLAELLGKNAFELMATLGKAGQLWWYAIWPPPGPSNWGLLVKQIYELGVLSIVIIVLSGFSIGAVLALQGYTQLVKFGAESSLGLGVALVLVMEIGPVVSALLFAGRAGSAVTAEVALMKATEQLSSMEMMGVDPVKQVLAPRLWAGFIALPVLALLFSLVGIWGASLIGVNWLGVYEGSFWVSMQDGVDFNEHVLKGIIKSIVFAMAVTWVSVFQGYYAQPTGEGIASATTRTVVYASISVLVLDFFLTLMMF